MECDIKNGRFLEHGEYDGNLYGTKISSIHDVIETGKICILDVNPQVEETGLPTLFGYFNFSRIEQLVAAEMLSVFSSIFIQQDLLMICIHSDNYFYTSY